MSAQIANQILLSLQDVAGSVAQVGADYRIDFRDGSVRNATPAEIAAAQAAFDAAEAARKQARLDRRELKAQFDTDKAKLDAAIDGITNATTLGELRGFVKDMAQVERRLLRSVKALVL